MFSEYLESERRVLRATAQVEVETGCPVIIHPGWNSAAPIEIMRIYQEAGGHGDRVVMSHMDSKCYFVLLLFFVPILDISKVVFDYVYVSIYVNREITLI